MLLTIVVFIVFKASHCSSLPFCSFYHILQLNISWYSCLPVTGHETWVTVFSALSCDFLVYASPLPCVYSRAASAGFWPVQQLLCRRLLPFLYLACILYYFLNMLFSLLDVLFWSSYPCSVFGTGCCDTGWLFDWVCVYVGSFDFCLPRPLHVCQFVCLSACLSACPWLV